MRQAAEVCGAIPTECDAEDETIKVSHLFVACDGKTYIGHECITQGGSSYSWSESYPQNLRGALAFVRHGADAPKVKAATVNVLVPVGPVGGVTQDE